MPKCQRAPVGWSCSRQAGHSGPCAASPAPCDLCQGIGFTPTNVSFSGMEAGEQPKLEVTLVRCPNGCEEKPEIILEWFGDSLS